MFKKFARTKVTDLTVGRSLAYNFAVPIVQIAGSERTGVAGVSERVMPKIDTAETAARKSAGTASIIPI